MNLTIGSKVKKATGEVVEIRNVRGSIATASSKRGGRYRFRVEVASDGTVFPVGGANTDPDEKWELLPVQFMVNRGEKVKVIAKKLNYLPNIEINRIYLETIKGILSRSFPDVIISGGRIGTKEGNLYNPDHFSIEQIRENIQLEKEIEDPGNIYFWKSEYGTLG